MFVAPQERAQRVHSLNSGSFVPGALNACFRFEQRTAVSVCMYVPVTPQVSGTNEVKANIKLRFAGRDGRVSKHYRRANEIYFLLFT